MYEYLLEGQAQKSSDPIEISYSGLDISEKFIEAGILLSSKNLENSKEIYEEIILSKNRF